MKVAIVGKGGVGKTTLTALLAGYLADEGRSVIAVDADPVANLAAALGLPDGPGITPIAEMAELIEERTGTKKGYGQFFQLNPRVDDLPERFCRTVGGIRLLVLGGVTSGGSGCFCPESAILKALVTHLLLRHDEVVLLDMEAGIEHLGRATAGAVSAMIAVVEPGMRSVHAAHTIHRLASEIGVPRVSAVINRVQTDTDVDAIAAALSPMPVVATLPYDSDIARADMQARAVYTGSPTQKEAMQKLLLAVTKEMP